MEWIQKAVEWLNDPAHRVVVAFLGGAALRKWPAFFNKAIPIATQVVNLIILALGAAFGVQASASILAPLQPALAHVLGLPLEFLVGTAHAASTADKVARVIFSPVVDSFVLVATASGIWSQAKNTVEWVRAGFRIFVPEHERQRAH